MRVDRIRLLRAAGAVALLIGVGAFLIYAAEILRDGHRPLAARFAEGLGATISCVLAAELILKAWFVKKSEDKVEIQESCEELGIVHICHDRKTLLKHIDIRP